MGCDHPSCVPVGPLVGETWHFEYFQTWRPSAILNFKNFNIWSHDCRCGPNLLLHTKFHQNWFMHSAYRRPWLQNVQCAVARQRLLPWQPHHGGHIGLMMGCDHPSCVPVGPLVGKLWHLEYFPTWWPSAILNFKNSNILSRDCRSGRNMLLCTKFYQNWFTRSASRRP